MASNRTRVIKASEIGIYKDLGLGLGVDATDPTPWTNRKPFRARNVTFKDVFGMTEGKLHSFSEEVMSIREFQSCVKASVPADQPIRVGINTEASWSYSVQKRSIGKKIISRIVTFKSRFEDVPICEAVEPDSGELSFESQLTDFIQKRTNNTSVESLNPETLTNHCFQFIKNSAVTHYVHRIELGACHYRTISEEEYNTMFGANTKMGVDEIAEIALNNKAEFKSYRFQSEVVEIGQLRERDSDQNEEVRDQKVVGVEFKSIISLVVKSEKLRKAMQEALSKYIVMREDCKCKNLMQQTYTYLLVCRRKPLHDSNISDTLVYVNS